MRCHSLTAAVGDHRGGADSRLVGAGGPSGPVHVVLGAQGKQRSVQVPFSVGAREAGGCGT